MSDAELLALCDAATEAEDHGLDVYHLYLERLAAAASPDTIRSLILRAQQAESAINLTVQSIADKWEAESIRANAAEARVTELEKRIAGIVDLLAYLADRVAHPDLRELLAPWRQPPADHIEAGRL